MVVRQFHDLPRQAFPERASAKRVVTVLHIQERAAEDVFHILGESTCVFEARANPLERSEGLT